MSGALSALFGGSTQSSTPTNVTPPETEALRGDWASTLSSLFGQGGGPAWGGPFAGQQTGGETQFLNQLQGNAAMGRQNLIEQTIGGQFLPGQPGQNPFLEAAITNAQRPTMQGLEETLSRSLPRVTRWCRTFKGSHWTIT
jgi:hypothetical protein